jgi:hypothetical protein
MGRTFAICAVIAAFVAAGVPLLGQPAPNQKLLLAPLTLCRLIEGAADFDGKALTVSARLLANLEEQLLFDDKCGPQPPTGDGRVEVNFAQRYDVRSPLNRRLEQLLSKKSNVQVVMRGKFEDPGHHVGHLNCCRYRFVVEQLVSIDN